MVSLPSGPDKHQVSFSLSSLLFSSHPHKITPFHNPPPSPPPLAESSLRAARATGPGCAVISRQFSYRQRMPGLCSRGRHDGRKKTRSDSRFRPPSAASSITGSLLAVEVRPAAENAPASSHGEDETHPSSLQGFEFYFFGFYTQQHKLP